MGKEIESKQIDEAKLSCRTGNIIQGNITLTESDLLEKLLDKSIKSINCYGNSALKGCKGLKLQEYDNAYYLGNEENPYIILLKAKSKDITSCVINNTTKIIYHNAFCNCNNLISITIPSSVKNIGKAAFFMCYRLVEIYNLSSLKIKKSPYNGYLGRYAKIIHTSLAEESYLTTKDDFIFIKDNKMKYYLLKYIGLKTDIVLPTDIEGNSYEIYDRAFEDCSSLTSIEIPSGVTDIGAFAFYDCSGLTNITIPNSVTSIDDFAFAGCSNLTSITIPNSVDYIGWNAFQECSNLISITIPDNVTSIVEETFYRCSSLSSITISNSMTSIEEGAFNHCDKLKEVFFKGVSENWNKIDIKKSNEELTSVTIYYYSETKPTESGNYWHYVDGVPTNW